MVPIYDYRCRNCGKAFELLIQHRDEKPVCPQCGSEDLERMLSVPAAIRMGGRGAKGKTCCGKDERCDTPPCSDGGVCRRDGDNA